MKPLSKKPDWGRCGFCNARVLPRRIKGEKKPVFLNPSPVYIILDNSSNEVFYYEGAWVRGRVTQDGLRAYTKHRCRHMRR